MTATEVNGLAVVTDEPHQAAFTDKAGNPVLQRQTRVLTLEDNTVVYGCAHCDYTSRNPNSIRPHLGKHNARRRNTAQAALTGREMSLADVLERLATVDALTSDRDKWRARAMKAERRLTALRNALGVKANEPVS
jgi:hypothetical protein